MKATLAAVLLACMTLPVLAQSLETSAGGSQAMDMAGVRTNYQYRGRYGWTGIGYRDGVRLGGYVNMPLNVIAPSGRQDGKYRLGLGDQALSADLDVDEYASHLFTSRGGSLLRKGKMDALQVFGGVLTQETAQPFFHVADQFSGDRFGAVLYQRRFSKKLQLHSLNVITDKITSIQSVGWKASPHWNLAAAGGMGANHGYLSGMGAYSGRHLDFRTSYTVASHEFHRQDGFNYDVEPLGWNGRLHFAPGTRFDLRISHDHTLTVIPPALASQTGILAGSSTGTLNSASVATHLKGFRFSNTVTENSSDVLPGATYSGVSAVSRRILPRWTLSGAFVDSNSPMQSMKAYQASSDVRVNSRLSVRQNFNRLDGRNNYTFGGQWSSNLLTLAVDNQLYLSPVASQFGQQTVFQAWTFSIRLRTPHGTTTNLSTTVDPFGKVQSGGYLTGLRYSALGSDSGEESHLPNFSKYMIWGRVKDEIGNAVSGIAVTIGAETLISDSKGEFFLHVKNGKPLPVSITRDSSVRVGRWVVTSAPDLARGSSESSASPVEIIVKIPTQMATNPLPTNSQNMQASTRE